MYNLLQELSSNAKTQSKNMEDRSEEIERIKDDLVDLERNRPKTSLSFLIYRPI